MTRLIHRPFDPLVGHRFNESFEVYLMDLDDRVIDELDGASGGKLDESIHTVIRASGSLNFTYHQPVDWHRHRIGITYTFRDERGYTHRYPQGVFLPTTPGSTYHAHVARGEVQLYDKTQMLNAGGMPSTWTVDKGVTIAQAVKDILATVGETRVSHPDDEGGELRNAMVFQPGTTKLRMVNDILEAGNFFGIWVDGDGVWQLQKYIPPAQRGVEWTHRSGENAIFKSGFKHTADGFNVPNEVVVIGRSERDDDGDEEEPPRALAWNQDPNDPFSIPSRGYTITAEPIQEQDATSLAVLEQIAQRRLLEMSSVTSTFEIDHAWLPNSLNSAVRLVVPEHDIDALTVLQSRSWSWEAGKRAGLTSSTLREVKA